MEHKNSIQRFTERARKILSLAQEEARLAQQPTIGTEYLLLAIAREEQGVAARVLARMGADEQALRAAMRTTLNHNQNATPIKRLAAQQENLGFDGHAIRVLDRAIDEAQRQNHYYVSTEHILLGLTHSTDSDAARILQSLGISLEKIKMRTASIQVLATASDSTSVAVAGQAGEARSSITYENEMEGQKLIERCDSSARKVLRRAQEEAMRYQHEYIGTEHLLLGLMYEREGASGQILQRLGIDQERVQRVVDQIVSPGTYKVRNAVRLSPATKRALESAWREAQRTQHKQMSSEHILLSLLGSGGGIAAKMLASLGASLERVRALQDPT